MMTTLSARQYPLLRLFVKRGDNQFMNLQEAATLNQTTFQSMLVRGWIRWEQGYGFTVTWEGKEAWHSFGHTSIERTGSSLNNPLCRWFYDHHPVEPSRPVGRQASSTGQRKRA